MTLRTWLLGTAALLTGCVSSIEKPTNPPPTGGTRAIFAPDAADPCASVLPFPSDLAKNPTTGKLDVPFCPSDDATTIALKTGLRTLDGYSINGPIYEEFSGPLDTASLSTPGAVMLGNASSFQLVPNVTPAFNPANNTLYLQLPAGTHLDEQTTYVAVITNAVKDTSGNPVISDQVFTLMKSKTPLVDAHGHSTTGALSDAEANGVEQLRKAYEPLFAGLEANGIPRETVAVAWPFTTQTVHASLPPLAQFVKATPATVTMDTSFPASSSALLVAQGLAADLGCVYTGRIQLQDLLTSTGTFGVGTGGAPAVTPTEVPYVLTTPAGVDCGAAWSTSNVAIYVHGLGRCKNDAFALAGTFAKIGYLTLALDGPYAGDRTVENLGDQNLDGCPDQPATPELIALPGQTPNPFAIRDALREWGLEQVQVAAAVKGNAWQFAGLDAPAGVTTTVGLVGHSWGGIAAVLAGSVSTDVTETATNATPGGLGAAFAPLLVAQLGEAAAPEAIATFTWVLEPADPLYAAEAFPRNDAGTVTGALAQVVDSDTGTVPDAPLHPTSGQKALAATLDQPAQTTFVMASGGTSYCDDSQSMVGELLKPCNAAALSPLDPTAPSVVIYAVMQKQLATFLATGGTFICTPNFQTGDCT